jgi:hypothetical protein
MTDQVYPEVNATNVLNFVNFTKEHAGMYQCVATNDHGTTVSGYVNVDMICEYKNNSEETGAQ